MPLVSSAAAAARAVLLADATVSQIRAAAGRACKLAKTPTTMPTT